MAQQPDVMRPGLLLLLGTAPSILAFSSCRHHHAVSIRLTSSARDDISEEISESWNIPLAPEISSSYRPPIIPFDITTVAESEMDSIPSPQELRVELPQVIPFCDDSFDLDDSICKRS